MNALAIAMVKNEADIIEAFVRHNLHFVDLMVVIDNLSTDGTREILQALRAEGLPLLIFDDGVYGHFQSEKVTLAYRKVAPVFQPEIVYLLDADEFLRAADRTAIERELAGLAPGSVALLPWRTHLPAASGIAAEQVRRDPLGTMTRRRRVETPVYHKAVIRRRPEDDACLVIEQGNHGVHLEGGRALRGVVLGDACIAHLPVRSAEQITAKAVNGWQACMVRNRFKPVPGEAYQWQQLYERIAAGQAIDDSMLEAVALGYAQTPRADRTAERDSVPDPTPPRYGALRYLHLGRHSALAKIVLGTEAYLRGAAVAAPPSGPDSGLAIDLAPLLDLTETLQARSICATPAGLPWIEALHDRKPSLEPPGDAGVDLLLAPRLTPADSKQLAGQLGGRVRKGLLCWSDRARGGNALRDEFAQWRQAGLEPDMLRTLGVRALASYAEVRQRAIVLKPAGAAPGQRTQAVCDALCAIADTPQPWRDPPAQRIDHPLQTLALPA